MRPPLVSDESFGPIHLVASAELSVEEINRIRVFIAERAGEFESQRISQTQQYRIRPHVEVHRERDGTETYRRFSCAGFVIEAYREGGVDMLETSGCWGHPPHGTGGWPSTVAAVDSSDPVLRGAGDFRWLAPFRRTRLRSLP